MAKRKKNTPKKKPNILKTIAWMLAIIALIFASSAVGFMIGENYMNTDESNTSNAKGASQLEILQKKEAKIIEEVSVNTRLKEVLKKDIQRVEKVEVEDVKTYGGASHEYITEKVKEAPLRIKRAPLVTNKPHEDKAKLVIIMDDVSVASHVRAIKNLGLNLTMSFLPPSRAIPNAAKLASQEEFYMVHLPMEAKSYSAEEPKTLRVRNSQEEISTRIAEIKRLFPKVRYINNHTGSTFTESEVAMRRLMVALNENNIHFLDSRTTSKTKVPNVMKTYGFKYMSRDVFLDHHNDKEYIKGQIKEAIRIAKIEGIAIAIGHPRKNTILALLESKAFLKEVDLVLLNKIY